MHIKNKPKLQSKELISKMKNEKGITFSYISEEQAIEFLQYHNNYTRTCSYRKNFQKHNLGKNKGKYIELDFAHLRELSILDMEIRFLITRLCSDIEHALKVNLVYAIEKDDTADGYRIVNDFLSAHPDILKRITLHKSSYAKELINKYFDINTAGQIDRYDDCPIWILVEILTFGDFITLYCFYSKQNNTSGDMYVEQSFLHLVKSLRNAAAHNNCLLCNLNIDSQVRPPQKLSKLFSEIPNTNKKKLKSRFLLELSTLLYVYSVTVHDGSKKYRVAELNNFFFGRLEKNKELFQKNALLWSSAVYIQDVVQHYILSSDEQPLDKI